MKPVLPWLRRWLAEPLVQFVVIGGGLFAVHAAVASREPLGTIHVSREQVQGLASRFSRSWQRPPSRRELQGLVDDWIREEAAVREARRLGLDRDDMVVRRRLRQKLEFLAEAEVERRKPLDGDLRAWLQAHQERYRLDARYSFRQIALGSGPGSGAGDTARIRSLLARLNAAGATVDPSSIGEPLLLLEPRYDQLPRREVERLFGQNFAKALASQRPGPWVGPVPSGYGQHLVQIEAITAGRMPQVAEVREQLLRDWLQDQQQRQREANDRARLARYRIERPTL